MGGFDQPSCSNRWGILPFLQVISANAPSFPGVGVCVCGGGGGKVYIDQCVNLFPVYLSLAVFLQRLFWYVSCNKLSRVLSAMTYWNNISTTGFVTLYQISCCCKNHSG